MKAFFSELRASVFNPSFYASLSERTVGSAFLYFTKLICFLALIATIAFSVPLVMGISAIAKALPDMVSDLYPSDLVLTLENGVLSATGTVPARIAIPERMQMITGELGIDTLAVIDPETPYAPQTFTAMRSLLWVHRDAVIARENNGQQVFPYPPEVSNTFTSTNVRTYADQFVAALRGLIPLLILGLFLLLVVGGFLHVPVIALTAVGVFFLGKALRRDWTYGRSFQFALHAMTAPVILALLSLPMLGGFIPLWLLYLVIPVAIVWMNVRKDDSVIRPQS